MLETLETSPCREEKHGSAGRKTSFGEPASFTLGRRVVYRRDEVSRWISKRESATRR
ncbi:DNA-binding protein [Mycobacterium tuberculosis]|nr:DNA-binding protein [Mycobacterium tuberculosis]